MVLLSLGLLIANIYNLVNVALELVFMAVLNGLNLEPHNCLTVVRVISNYWSTDPS